MNDSERLASQLERALNGGAWHGPSWREVLAGVSRTGALRRPIPEAHTIAEIVFHATTWHDVVRRRLAGELPHVSEAEDWPAAFVPDDAAWAAAAARLLATGRSLCEEVARFPADRLHEPRSGLDATWFDLVLGQLQHALYHAGQIALLRKAAVEAP